MDGLRQISSLDGREPAVRFLKGWNAALRIEPMTGKWDEHSEAGYDAGKEATAAMEKAIAERYGVTFYAVRPCAD